MLPEAAAACIYLAAQAANLPPPILMTVLTVEAGHEGTHSPNSNGSEDYGPGQINTVWVDEIARTIHQSPETTRALLRYDGCFNIRVTANLLRRSRRTHRSSPRLGRTRDGSARRTWNRSDSDDRQLVGRYAPV